MQPTQSNETACVELDSFPHERRARDARCASFTSCAVFILSDVCFVREGLLTAFRSDRFFSTVAAGVTAEDALAAESPGVLLLDAVFPEAEAVGQKLVHAIHHCQLVVLGIEEQTEIVIEWARLGAIGYVPRHASLSQLLNTVKGVIRGEQVCSPAIAGGLIRYISGMPPTVQNDSACGDTQLTIREAEILPLLGQGSSNKDIARHLNIEVATAKCHVHNIMSKLGLQRRAQVAHWIQAQRVKGAGQLYGR